MQIQLTPEMAQKLAARLNSGSDEPDQLELGRRGRMPRHGGPRARLATRGPLRRLLRPQSPNGEHQVEASEAPDEETDGQVSGLSNATSSVYPPRPLPRPESDYGPTTQLSPLIRISVQNGYRVVFAEVKPGVHILLTIAEQLPSQTLRTVGFDPLTTSMAAAALSNPSVLSALAQGVSSLAQGVSSVMSNFRPGQHAPQRPPHYQPHPEQTHAALPHAAQPQTLALLPAPPPQPAPFAGYSAQPQHTFLPVPYTGEERVACCGTCQANSSHLLNHY